MKLKPHSPIPWAKPAIDDVELNEVIACMKSGWLTSGPRVEQFEQEMANRAGRAFGVAVSNGTAALDLALRVVNIRPGDEVIVPALSYVATASTVAMQGAKPIFADVDERNFGLDPNQVARKITNNTRAIISTDHGGCPCDYAGLSRISAEYNVPLIVDGAQSIGTTFAGKSALSYGLISTTSFHAAKTITTVEGGMVFTDDPKLNRRLKMIRSQGEDPGQKYYHIELGHNFRMTELQAAIGLAQLTKLDALLSERQELAGEYRRLFADSDLQSPPGLPGGGNSYFLFSLLVPCRDAVMQSLKQRGIDTRSCYPRPLYDQPIFRSANRPSCPVTEKICGQIINPPMFHGLTRQQQLRVAIELQNVIEEIESPALRKAV
jgi:dTDP-4-amino-4,6-dideoxygalactose transaminase